MEELKKVSKRLKKTAQAPHVPTFEDPIAELRVLVNEHKAIVRAQQQTVGRSSDRENRTTGEIMPSRLPKDVQEREKAYAKELSLRAAQQESRMLKELRKVPIYNAFLKHVFGVGPVLSSYLVTHVDINKATKPSNLRRFCGLAVINGRLERPTRGVKLGYVAELRTRIFQAFAAMWKNGAKLNGSTKYLDVWRDYKNRMQHSERYDSEANTLLEFGEEGGVRKGAKACIHAAGWHKAADVFLEDLYTVWRAQEGLGVWPSYYAAKLGYEHGGKISVNAPKLLTLEEALETVGHVGKRELPIAAEE